MLCSWVLVALVEQCVAKLVHGVLLLYLVVSSALERTLAIGSCKSEKRAAKLHYTEHLSCSAAAINIMDFELLVSFQQRSRSIISHFFAH